MKWDDGGGLTSALTKGQKSEEARCKAYESKLVDGPVSVEFQDWFTNISIKIFQSAKTTNC